VCAPLARFVGPEIRAGVCGQAIIVIFMTRALAVVLHMIGQPRVIAEVLGGIILGPSVFGYIPGFEEKLFPKKSIANLQLVANLGLILYLFLVGVELDPKTMVENARRALFIATIGIVVPFGLGFVIAPSLYSHMGTSSDNQKPTPMSFAVFIR
jgi:Kef-type K+ transport system membrane component KefB